MIRHKALLLSEEFKLPHHLKEWKYKIRDYALHYGLNINTSIESDVSRKLEENEVIFQIVDYEQMNAIAARGGFPVRYPHWQWYMEEDELSKGNEYGLHKIYEMVINSKPTYAYLLETNGIADHKTVMGHVFGHVDFFRNNVYFSSTHPRHIIDTMANHAVRVRKFIEKHGSETVFDWIDKCLSIENLIDIHSVAIQRHEEKKKEVIGIDKEDDDKKPTRFLQDEKYKDYMNGFINPPEEIAKEIEKIEKEKEKKKDVETGKKIPEERERDVVQFLIDYAPLENWQREILSIVHEEAYYFAPQAQTKILNEGWASYWHSKMMTGSDWDDEYQKGNALPPLLTDSEIIDYAEHHSGTLATTPGRLNPYKLGIELFRYIEERWNKGKFGKEWDNCVEYGSYEDQKNWNKKLGLGRKKIFEVRKLYNDVTFIDEFLTRDFCEEYKLFTYEYNEDNNLYEIATRDFANIKRTLLTNLTNMGQPFIYVIDGNFNNRSELLLYHRHYGIDLKYDYARDVIRRIYDIWGKPVNLRTKIDGGKHILTFDGEEIYDEEIK